MVLLRSPPSLPPPSFLAGVAGHAIPVVFHADPGESIRDLLEQVDGPIAIVTDDVVAPLALPALRRALSHCHVPLAELVFPAGEASKRWTTLEQLATTAFRAGVARDSLLVAVGGGVCLDLAGFLASIYMRGIPHVNVPTSLLGMVDVALGGKTGIDTPEGKNLLGSLHHPVAVVVSVPFLDTLPPQEWTAGLGEMIKTAIVGDATLFDSLCRWAADGMPARPAGWEPWIASCLRVKAAIVGQDHDERGVRAVLNFGHTVGHAVESNSRYAISHGPAVAIGMRCESLLAHRLGLLPQTSLHSIVGLLDAVGLPASVRSTPQQLLSAMQFDKKRRGGRLRLSLPTNGIGLMASCQGPWTSEVPEADLLDALGSICSA